MTEQDGGYAARSLKQVLSSCLCEDSLLWFPQAESDISYASITSRIESPLDALGRMRYRVKLHRALLIAEAGSPPPSRKLQGEAR